MVQVLPNKARRPRIGMLVPSCNNVVESDFARAFAGSVSLHGMRMWSGDACTPDAHQDMNREAEQGATYLGSARIDVLAYCCTAGSFGDGLEAATRQEAALSAAAGGIPCVTAAGAVLDALRSLGASKVAIVTPYSDEENARLARFLEDAELEPTTNVGRGYLSNNQINDDDPESIAAFVTASRPAQCDALFLSCTNWRAFDVIGQLEQELQMPVVTSNSALIWATSASAHAGLRGDRPGRLLGRIA